MVVHAMNKRAKLQICMIVMEIMNETSESSSEEDELLQLTSVIRPRIQNYIDVVHEYSEREFKNHFR